MAIPNQIAASGTDELTVYNDSTSAIAAAIAVAIDTGVTPAPSQCLGVKLTTADTDVIGVTQTIIPAKKTGKIKLVGSTCVATSGAALATLGTYLMTNNAGKVIAQTAGKFGMGINLSTAAGADEPVLVLLALAKNA